MATQVLANFFITSIFLQAVSAASDTWTYTYQNDWPKLCKNGIRQSPIDIETKRISVNTSLYIETKLYDKEYKNFRLTNNGHTAQLSLELSDGESDRPEISGWAVDNQVYVFEQLHFHWSTEKGRGSEHAINGRLHSMEMHLVHYNKKYGNLSEAVNHEDGLAVLGILMDITRKINPFLEPIIDGVKFVTKEGTDDYMNRKYERRDQPISAIKFEDLLPNDMSLFFRYRGSLTTPPCAEVVTWILYHDTTDIGLNQIKAFRAMTDSKKHFLSDTFRYLQSTNDRKIEVSKRDAKQLRGMASRVDCTGVTTLLSIITSLLLLSKY